MHRRHTPLLLTFLLSLAISTAGQAAHAAGMKQPTGSFLTSWTAPIAATATQLVATRLSREDQDTLSLGTAAFEIGNYPEALALLTPLAERGDGYAQAMLSRLYAGQPGVPKDDAAALKWAQAAADRNDPEGLLALAALYYTGTAVPKNVSHAADIVERAANAGHARAQAQLGLMYAQGDGRKKDDDAARKWFLTAAKQGQWNAQIMLGRLVLNEGTLLGAALPTPDMPRDNFKRKPVDESVKQSADAGDADAKLEVARGLYAAALYAETDVPQQVVELVEEAATSGHPMAQFAAGALHSDGFHGVPNDAARAKAWFDKGVAQLP